MNRRQQKEQKRQRKRRERQAARRAQPRRTEVPAADVRVTHPELAYPPVYVDRAGARIEDPYASLGLDPERDWTSDEIQSTLR